MNKNNFAMKLVELRKQNKYTQKYIAQNIGVTTRVYQYCESGHIPSSYNTIIKLCQFFNIDANELFGMGKITLYPNIND